MSAQAYQAALISLSLNTDSRIQILLRQYQAGTLSLERLLSLASQIVVAANRASVTLANLSLAGQITRGTGRRVPALVVPAAAVFVDRDRVAEAVAQILDEVPDYVQAIEDEDERTGALHTSQSQRLSRLTVDEPTEAGTRTMDEGITRYRIESDVPIRGWRRRLDATPCKLCRNWEGDGRVYRAETRFWRHTGDQCVPELVFAPERR